ncbi:5448_t:CDS:2 [Entrophospora sp. SA101]|nr:5448_t:CDS:2 [Entrophospora sp. SA101]
MEIQYILNNEPSTVTYFVLEKEPEEDIFTNGSSIVAKILNIRKSHEAYSDSKHLHKVSNIMRLDNAYENINTNTANQLITQITSNDSGQTVRRRFQRANMNIQWSNTYNTKKQSFNYDCLLPMIDHKNWIPDELHLMLRIRDILLECLFSDLCRNLKKFENEMANRIIEETRRIGITKFEFYDLKSSKCNWTTLNGSDKLKFLEFFLVSKFYNNEKGINIEKMWREFVCLYKLIRKTALSDIEIDNFQKDVKQWIKTFTNIYRSEDVTPYMHVFAMHIPQFLKELKNQALSLRGVDVDSGDDDKDVID